MIKCKEAVSHQCCMGVGGKRKEVVTCSVSWSCFMSSAQSSRRNEGEAESFLVCLGLHREHKIIIIIPLYLSDDESLK